MIAAVVYSKLAPFHVARLNTTGLAGKKESHRLVGIEIAGKKSDYQWPDVAEAGHYYQRRTLFPGRDYWTLSYPKVRCALRRALEEITPDVVVLSGWAFKQSLVGLGWCLKRGVPRVIISDSQGMDNPQTAVKVWIKRFLLRWFQTGFVGGQPHVRYLATLGLVQERCFVGCDVVDNDFFARESQRWKVRPHQDRNRGSILSCLRLLPRKNIPAVLDVLSSRKSQWTWTIAGDGPQRPQIEQRVKALGMSEQVRLVGQVDYFDLPRLYGQADVYLQPSLSEPWGLAVNEAMASELPVVISNRCGCREDLVREGINGLIFDPAKPETLTVALDRLWSQRERWPEMGKASQQIVAQWGLDLFARNFWAACQNALRLAPEAGNRPVSERVLGLAL